MSKIYTEQELTDLISKVEFEFSAHLAKAENEIKAQALTKSNLDKYSKMAKNEDEKEEKEDKQEDKKEEAKEDSQDEKAEDKKDQEEGHDYDEDELEELHKLYKGMSDSERSLHHSVIKKCMAKTDDEQKADDQIAKSEKNTIVNEDGAKELSLAKSEIEALKMANAELKKSLESIVETLNRKFVKPAVAPQRKAVTELTVLNKTEQAPAELSRKEIVKKLEKVAATPDLKKSDREVINAYCVGNGTLDSIQHLLNK